MLEPYEQRSFNHPLIGLYEKLKMNSGYLAFCYRYHSTELSKYFCVSVVSLSLPPPLSLHMYLFILKSVNHAHKQKSRHLEWGDTFVAESCNTFRNTNCYPSRGKRLCVGVVIMLWGCLFLSFDLWSSKDQRPKVAFDPNTFYVRYNSYQRWSSKHGGFDLKASCYVTWPCITAACIYTWLTCSC